MTIQQNLSSFKHKPCLRDKNNLSYFLLKASVVKGKLVTDSKHLLQLDIDELFYKELCHILTFQEPAEDLEIPELKVNIALKNQ